MPGADPPSADFQLRRSSRSDRGVHRAAHPDLIDPQKEVVCSPSCGAGAEPTSLRNANDRRYLKNLLIDQILSIILIRAVSMILTTLMTREFGLIGNKLATTLPT